MMTMTQCRQNEWWHEIISAIFWKFSRQKSWGFNSYLFAAVVVPSFVFFICYIPPITLHSYLFSGNFPTGTYQFCVWITHTYTKWNWKIMMWLVVAIRIICTRVFVILLFHSAWYNEGHWLWFAIIVWWLRKCDELEIVSLFYLCVFIGLNSCLRNVCGLSGDFQTLHLEQQPHKIQSIRECSVEEFTSFYNNNYFAVRRFKLVKVFFSFFPLNKFNYVKNIFSCLCHFLPSLYNSVYLNCSKLIENV